MQIKAQQTEFKFLDAGKSLAFAGYASKFNGIDWYGDMILPGAYAETITNRQQPVLMKRNHRDVIGKWVSMYEDDQGLYVEGELTPGNSMASDTYALLKHGAISGLSIGFRVKESEDAAMDGKSVRILKSIDLIEISVVDSPADLHARITDVKDAESLKDVESLLRFRGFSRSEATAIVAQVKSISRGERADDGKQLADLIRNYKLL